MYVARSISSPASRTNPRTSNVALGLLVGTFAVGAAGAGDAVTGWAATNWLPAGATIAYRCCCCCCAWNPEDGCSVYAGCAYACCCCWCCCVWRPPCWYCCCCGCGCCDAGGRAAAAGAALPTAEVAFCAEPDATTKLICCDPDVAYGGEPSLAAAVYMGALLPSWRTPVYTPAEGTAAGAPLARWLLLLLPGDDASLVISAYAGRGLADDGDVVAGARLYAAGRGAVAADDAGAPPGDHVPVWPAAAALDVVELSGDPPAAFPGSNGAAFGLGESFDAGGVSLPLVTSKDIWLAGVLGKKQH
mmetsp:Transcript_46107/g.142007  ORF Transcript_46107/g.142007 Transcript_46107/m.142007 type:complete len:303 (-) Transcript_46107:48-956(-)